MEVKHRAFALLNSLFRNVGHFAFQDVSATAGNAFTTPAPHRVAAFGDFNNDGKVGIAVTMLNGSPELLINRTANGNHWILFKLVGVKDNRDGLGTRVKITTSHGSQYNEATTVVGYNSSSDKRVHFGLGSDTVIDRIELAWPIGVKQTLTGVNADQVLTILERADAN